MAEYIIAHDLGTSGDKATLFTVDGRVVKSCTFSYDVRFFGKNCAEQNPLVERSMQGDERYTGGY